MVLVAGCGFPKPGDVAGDASDPHQTPGDTGSLPSPDSILHVSPSGDDANDGVTAPVRTLKHAIGIAAANTQIAQIVLAAGHYSAESGESFPYSVPRALTIIGPQFDDAELTGSGTETGLSIDSGIIQNIVLDSFAVAISVTGTTQLNNLRVRSSDTAIIGQGMAVIAVDEFDVTGKIANTQVDCSKGIDISDSSILHVNSLTARNLAVSISARDSSTVSINNANIAQDKCSGTAIVIASSKPFALSNGYIVGGVSALSFINAADSPVEASVADTTMLDMNQPLGGRSVTFKMTGGEMSGNARGVLESSSGNWMFENVKINNNGVFGIYLQGTRQNGVSTSSFLTMRGCTITGNSGAGISLLDGAIVDVGTDADPGGNVIQGNSSVGIAMLGIDGPRQLNAVGNTWNVNAQGTDGNGRYLNAQTIAGPVTLSNGNNYSIDSGLSLRR